VSACCDHKSARKRPSIILADEPTGNPDTNTGDKIMKMFEDINRDGRIIILITHDPRSLRTLTGLFA
jgi:ABC-type lipoprotein export system ATPase subunit